MNLRAIKFAGYTHLLGAPPDWDEAIGPCAALPVIIDADSEGRYYLSMWKLNWKQKIQVLFGYSIQLTCVGSQAPVMLTTFRANEIK